MKIRNQSFLILVVLALVLSAALALVARRVMTSASREYSIERIRAEVGLLGTALRSLPSQDDLPSFAAGARQQLGFRVTLIGPDGTVLADSSLDARGVAAMENHLDRPEVKQALTEGRGESLRQSATTGVDYYYIAQKLDDGPSPVWFVRLALPASELEQLGARSGSILVMAFLLALLLQALIGWFLLRRLSVPVEKISRQLSEAPETEIDYRGSREIGTLAATVNRLRRRHEVQIGKIQSKQRVLATAVSTMREALLVVGPDRRILLANDAFRKNLGFADDPTGKLLAQVIRYPAVLRDLDAVLENEPETHDTTFHADDVDRTFAVHITPLEAGALILFFDITRLETLENVRRDFVANVSHELRTPLTSIKAFVETLLEGGLEDPESALEFLRIVRKHSSRMEALIDDLTDLSLIETGSVELELDDLDAHAVAEEVVEQVGHRYGGAEVSIRNDIPAPFPLRADRRRLEQILVNLVDNAVKFNRPRGSVRLAATRGETGATLIVEDTGFGIPHDSQEKIFHRFFQVDKARSREVGGTGLGLAIVKHLVRLHGGTIRYEANGEQGARFAVEFPDG